MRSVRVSIGSRGHTVSLSTKDREDSESRRRAVGPSVGPHRRFIADRFFSSINSSFEVSTTKIGVTRNVVNTWRSLSPWPRVPFPRIMMVKSARTVVPVFAFSANRTRDHPLI